MPYAFSQDMQSGKDFYTGLSDGIGDRVPDGLIVHLAFETASGTRIVDVWESEEQFDTFRNERLRPAMEKVLQDLGVTRESLGEPQEEELKPIEVFGKSVTKRRF